MTSESVCDESKRKELDRERLARRNAAAAEGARMMATQPSVADSLRAKWKAEDERVWKDEDMRTRQARKTAQTVPSDTSFYKRCVRLPKPHMFHSRESNRRHTAQ